jgi:archaellum component FlaC
MRETLATASDLLASAADDAGDHTDRLRDLSDQLGSLADQDRDVDHGRLARIQSGLDEIQPDVSDEVAATIDEANDEINAFRETIEGV